MNHLLKKARSLVDSEPDEAMRLCNQVLNEDPDSEDAQLALFMSGYIMMQAERFGMAYHIYKRCAEMRPEVSEIWSNMGMCLESTNSSKALKCFRNASRLDPKNPHPIANSGLMHLQLGSPNLCIRESNKALEIDPNIRSAKHNRGLAKLMLRDWSGWKDYADTLGVEHRERRDYGLPEWNGEDGEVLVYGEQGVGDEIMFASCLPDLARRNAIVFDCDKRLETLFSRSFDFPVYGTRFKTETPILDNHTPDYQCAIGQLPSFFRKSSNSFPGSSYMTPDKERVNQWDCLMSKDKPRIGIAWKGGLKNTGEKHRTSSLEDFKPLFDIDAEFVNLEYKDVDKDEMDSFGIHNWPRAVLKGCDLEETFALVSNLDFVVTVCTSMVYFAGSQGIDTRVLVPETPGYRYHIDGDSFPWYNSVKLYRGKFNKSINRIVNDIKNIHRVRSCRDSNLSCAV